MKRNNFLKILACIPFIGINIPVKAINLEATLFTPEMLSRNNFGLFIINIKAGNVLTTKNIGYAATVAWKLTYCNHQLTKPYENLRYGLTNVFTDGWFYPTSKNKEDLCEYLNNNLYGEKFRVITKEEVLFLISKRQQGFL